MAHLFVDVGYDGVPDCWTGGELSWLLLALPIVVEPAGSGVGGAIRRQAGGRRRRAGFAGRRRASFAGRRAAGRCGAVESRSGVADTSARLEAGGDGFSLRRSEVLTVVVLGVPVAVWQTLGPPWYDSVAGELCRRPRPSSSWGWRGRAWRWAGSRRRRNTFFVVGGLPRRAACWHRRRLRTCRQPGGRPRRASRTLFEATNRTRPRGPDADVPDGSAKMEQGAGKRSLRRAALLPVVLPAGRAAVWPTWSPRWSLSAVGGAREAVWPTRSPRWSLSAAGELLDEWRSWS